MDRETSAKVFHYQFSQASKFTNSHVMGYGLPLARLYARYFHGDLRVTSYHVSRVFCLLFFDTLVLGLRH